MVRGLGHPQRRCLNEKDMEMLMMFVSLLMILEDLHLHLLFLVKLFLRKVVKKRDLMRTV